MVQLPKDFNYQGLTDLDVISKVEPLLQAGVYKIREDGRLACKMNQPWDTPWVHVVHLAHLKCHLWHHVYFQYYGFVPSGCQNCWKIVVRPNTVEQLFKLYELQVQMNYPAKCGIELRDSVNGNYGGYFYTSSVEEGRERWAEVSRRVREEISPDIKVILKRACTEYEHANPDSSTWDISDDQVYLERILDSIFVQDAVKLMQPDHAKAHVMRTWIHRAFSIKDMTYVKYTGGKPLFPPYKTYHE